jgi:hypothetical protein
MFLKIKESWETLNETSREQIRKLLVETLLQYKNENILLTRLCLCLCSFTINMVFLLII